MRSHEDTDMDIVKKIAGYMLCFYCTQTHNYETYNMNFPVNYFNTFFARCRHKEVPPGAARTPRYASRVDNRGSDVTSCFRIKVRTDAT